MCLPMVRGLGRGLRRSVAAEPSGIREERLAGRARAAPALWHGGRKGESQVDLDGVYGDQSWTSTARGPHNFLSYAKLRATQPVAIPGNVDANNAALTGLSVRMTDRDSDVR